MLPLSQADTLKKVEMDAWKKAVLVMVELWEQSELRVK